jgi:hypothetical protein
MTTEALQTGLMMNDADARRQTPGLQINNPGGMIL